MNHTGCFYANYYMKTKSWGDELKSNGEFINWRVGEITTSEKKGLTWSVLSEEKSITHRG